MKNVQRIQAIVAIVSLFLLGTLAGCQNALSPAGSSNVETTFQTSSGIGQSARDVSAETTPEGYVGELATGATINLLIDYLDGANYRHLKIRAVAYPKVTIGKVLIYKRASNGGNYSLIWSSPNLSTTDYTSPEKTFLNTLLSPYGGNIYVLNTAGQTIGSRVISNLVPQ